jgi:hypothetical protein
MACCCNQCNNPRPTSITADVTRPEGLYDYYKRIASTPGCSFLYERQYALWRDCSGTYSLTSLGLDNSGREVWRYYFNDSAYIELRVPCPASADGAGLTYSFVAGFPVEFFEPVTACSALPAKPSVSLGEGVWKPYSGGLVGSTPLPHSLTFSTTFLSGVSRVDNQYPGDSTACNADPFEYFERKPPVFVDPFTFNFRCPRFDWSVTFNIS